ncbi:MAG: acyl-CoA thioesterase [Butyricicoccus sp.]
MDGSLRPKSNTTKTDGMGIVHHSNYIRWFEEARVDLLEQLGFPRPH